MPAVMTLLMLLSSFGTALWPSGMILCIGENGSAALEGIDSRCSAGTEAPGVQAPRSSEGCGACKDLVSVDARPRQHLPAALPVPALSPEGCEATPRDVVRSPLSMLAGDLRLPPPLRISCVLRL